MKSFIGLVGAAVLVAAAPAKAETLLFTLAGVDDQASFTLDSNPGGTTVTNQDGTQYFGVDNVAGAYSGTGDGPLGNSTGPQTVGNLQFYDEVSGGGIEVNESNGFGIFSLTGAQVFNGSVDSPTFAPGTFTFTNDYFYGPTTGSETLTISEVSAAPEPSTWALMIAGVGMIGATLRLGRRRAALATA